MDFNQFLLFISQDSDHFMGFLCVLGLVCETSVRVAKGLGSKKVIYMKNNGIDLEKNEAA